MAKIYCVEDDQSIRELILYALKSSGYEGEGFEESESFFMAIEKELPSLVLLDIMLPGKDGLAILNNLRFSNRTKEIPVILLTAKTSEYDKVIGLDLGADDYVCKPFGVMELISRIKALLRRTDKPSDTEELQFQDLVLNYDKRTVLVDGKPCTLTYKEFELLYYLMKNVNLVLSRDKIMQTVWGFDFEGESRTVDMHIKSLRQKLGKAGEVIRTVRGVGYKIGG